MNASQIYHDLSQSIRTPIVALLNQQLADLLDLGLQAKQAHWNVKGRNFFGLHELFDKSAEELNESSDRVAERAVQLGGFAMGTLQAISGSSRLPAYPTDLVTGLGHVEVLVSALRKLAHTTAAGN